MAKAEVLVVDDEEDICELVRCSLAREGYDVKCAGTGEEAWDMIQMQPPNLVVLDWMLPGMDGLDVCRHIKSDPKTDQTQVIMLTAKGEESDIVAGLEVGADDYVTKPFSPKVLVARVRRMLRKKIEHSLDRKRVEVHNLVIDPTRCEAKVAGKSIDLTFTEFNVLYTLAKRPGVVFTRYQIVDAVHGDNYIVSDRAVDVQVAYLRRKLGRYKNYIETVRGVGYRFRD